MESRLDVILSELKEMNETLKGISGSLGTIATALDYGLVDIREAIRSKR